MSITNKDNRTVHGVAKFGFNTPHRYPTFNAGAKDFTNLVNSLYPTGRAWYLPEDSVYKAFHEVMNKSFLRVKDYISLMMDGYFPDNDNFNESDCVFWENKLGLITSNSLSLEQRKQIIYRKIAFPQNIKARQHITYIQSQIDLYGFDCKVYENIFQDVNGNYYHESPENIIQQTLLDTQHGNGIQHGGGIQHGKGSFDVIANQISDEIYNIGGDNHLWATFFIASKNTLYAGATIPKDRKDEFKELILKLKPAHLIAFCLINYE